MNNKFICIIRNVQYSWNKHSVILINMQFLCFILNKEIFAIYSLTRMHSAGILNYLEKKWITQQIYIQSNYHPSNSFQSVEYMHIRLTNWFFLMMMIISVLICILENVWYKQHARKFKKKNSNLILLGTRDNNLNVMKTYYEMKSRFKWRRKFNLQLLSRNIKNPEFLQNVTIQINRW